METKKFDDFLENPVKQGAYKLIFDFKEDYLLKIRDIFASDFEDDEDSTDDNYKSLLILLRSISYLSLSEQKSKKIGKDDQLKSFIKYLGLVFKNFKSKAYKLKLESEPFNHRCTRLHAEEEIMIWKYLYFKKFEDVLYCKIIESEDYLVRIIFYSLKCELLEALRKMLKIMFQNFDFDIKQPCRIHEYEEVVSIYPMALALSLSEKDSSEFGLVVDDLDLAIKYYFHFFNAYRECVIFAGVALEEQIVLIYENEIKEKAHESLGRLFHKLKKESVIPESMKAVISQAIDIRNASVHRGMDIFESRDAIKAVVAPAMLLIWYGRKKGRLK
ncbi:MAG: hypothetical protein KAW45_03435 [Thermoplasmatales archaeon]|nr:hypothetical protein [Thermoplasmatales archaeon]